VKTIAPANLIAYWPLSDLVGSTTAADESGNGRTGACTAVTFGQQGIGDGRRAASFDGSTSLCNVYSASLAGVFPTAEGTLEGWFLCNDWADGVNRRTVIFQASSQNRIIFNKGSGANTANLTYIAGNVNKNIAITMSPTGFFHLALTWSVAADQVIGYLNGVQQGATLTGLGTWVGALAATTCVIGAGDTAPANVWSGRAAHVALWNTPLSAAQIAALAGA
jgi:hypothetical protein